MDHIRFVVLVTVLSFAATTLLIVAVFATGSTFGQRCSRAGFSGAEWDDCVHRLATSERNE